MSGFVHDPQDTFPGFVNVEVLDARDGAAEGALDVQAVHLAPNGYLHAGAVVTLADTVAGFGCIASLPEGATGFTTIELKTNFMGTARAGCLSCDATLVHGGRTTQVWDATVRNAEGKAIAAFRCTQLLLY